MEVTKVSVVSGITHTREISITQEEIDYWQTHKHPIQDVFPHLSADDREFLLTGTTPEEWDVMFDEEEKYHND